jgi:phosphatidylinositol glycan class Z
MTWLCLEVTVVSTDYSVSSLVHNPESRRYALLLLASSHVMHTFQTRPFSNSIEAVLVAMCFVLFRNFVAERPKNYGKVPTKLFL